MDGDGVSDVSEGVGRMVNGIGLTSGSIARSGACVSGDWYQQGVSRGCVVFGR